MVRRVIRPPGRTGLRSRLQAGVLVLVLVLGLLCGAWLSAPAGGRAPQAPVDLSKGHLRTWVYA